MWAEIPDSLIPGAVGKGKWGNLLNTINSTVLQINKNTINNNVYNKG